MNHDSPPKWIKLFNKPRNHKGLVFHKLGSEIPVLLSEVMLVFHPLRLPLIPLAPSHRDARVVLPPNQEIPPTGRLGQLSSCHSAQAENLLPADGHTAFYPAVCISSHSPTQLQHQVTASSDQQRFKGRCVSRQTARQNKPYSPQAKHWPKSVKRNRQPEHFTPSSLCLNITM